MGVWFTRVLLVAIAAGVVVGGIATTGGDAYAKTRTKRLPADKVEQSSSYVVRGSTTAHAACAGRLMVAIAYKKGEGTLTTWALVGLDGSWRVEIPEITTGKWTFEASLIGHPTDPVEQWSKKKGKVRPGRTATTDLGHLNIDPC